MTLILVKVTLTSPCVGPEYCTWPVEAVSAINVPNEQTHVRPQLTSPLRLEQITLAPHQSNDQG